MSANREEEESGREEGGSGQESGRESSGLATTESLESWKGESEAKQTLGMSNTGNGSVNVSGRLAVEDKKEDDDGGSKREVGAGKAGGGVGVGRNDGGDSDNDDDGHGDEGDDSSEDEMYNLTVSRRVCIQIDERSNTLALSHDSRIEPQ